MKSVVKRMQGRQIYQSLQPLPFTTNDGIANNLNIPLYQVVPLSPANLNTAVFAGAPDADTEYYLEKALQWIEVRNAGQQPAHYRIVYIRFRTDYSGTLASILEKGDVPTVGGSPYMSPTTGQFFQKMCRITRIKTGTLYPGRMKRYKLKDNYFNNRAITPEREGDQATLSFLKGTALFFLQFWGAPVWEEAQSDNMTLATLRLIGVSYKYYSYRRMGHQDANSIWANGVPSRVTASGTTDMTATIPFDNSYSFSTPFSGVGQKSKLVTTI